MRQFIPIMLVLCLIFMSGCSEDNLTAGKGSEFIGTWHSKAYSIEIKRNGDYFILVMLRGKEQPKEYPLPDARGQSAMRRAVAIAIVSVWRGL